MPLSKEEFADRVYKIADQIREPTPEILQKTKALAAQVEQEIKSATSASLQALLRKMHQVLQSMDPAGPKYRGLDEDINIVLQRYVKDPNSPKPFPSIVSRVLQHIYEYLSVTNYPSAEMDRLKADYMGTAAPPPGPENKPTPKRIGDGFESMPATSGLNLNPPIAPVPPPLAQGQQAATVGQQLESFQVWMGDPARSKK